MNAKQELSHYLKFGDIKCATIKWFDVSSEMMQRHLPDEEIKVRDSLNLSLKVGHTQQEFDAFMDALDFEYDDGYGSQELHGIIWLSNGNWMSRWEYDGSEGWQSNSLPEIPEELK